MVVHTSNPSTTETEVGWSAIPSYPRLQSKTKAKEKKQKNKDSFGEILLRQQRSMVSITL